MEYFPRELGRVLERMGSYGFLILYALMFFGAFNVVLNPCFEVCYGFGRPHFRVFPDDGTQR